MTPDPFAQDAERQIAAMAVMNSPILDDGLAELEERDFGTTAYREIFAAARRLHHRGEPVDLVTVTNEANGRVSAATVSEVADIYVTSVNNAYYVGLVRDEARLRRLAGAAATVLERAKNRKPLDRTADVIADCASTLLDAVMINEPVDAVKPLAEIVLPWIEKVIAEAEEHRPPGIATGLVDLDRVTGGLARETMTVIAARTSHGKSALLLEILLRARVPALLVSLEMSTSQVLARMAAQLSEVSVSRIARRDLGREDFDRLRQAGEELGRIPIWVDDRRGATVQQIRTAAHRLVRTQGVAIVAVDYLGLVRAPEGRARHEELAHVSRELRNLAGDLNVAVVALAQLNREPAKRPNQVPLLTDIAESDRIVCDADAVFLLHRPDLQKTCSTADLYIRKLREGPLRKITFTWDGRLTRFLDHAREQACSSGFRSEV